MNALSENMFYLEKPEDNMESVVYEVPMFRSLERLMGNTYTLLPSGKWEFSHQPCSL